MTAFFRAWRERRRQIRDDRERAAIAKAFNDRYCFRVEYNRNSPRLTGTAVFGILPRGGNRWMCPWCNSIHAPISCSAFSGLQYPECCGTPEGPRLDYGIRLPSDKDVLP